MILYHPLDSLKTCISSLVSFGSFVLSSIEDLKSMTMNYLHVVDFLSNILNRSTLEPRHL